MAALLASCSASGLPDSVEIIDDQNRTIVLERSGSTFTSDNIEVSFTKTQEGLAATLHSPFRLTAARSSGTGADGSPQEKFRYRIKASGHLRASGLDGNPSPRKMESAWPGSDIRLGTPGRVTVVQNLSITS